MDGTTLTGTPGIIKLSIFLFDRNFLLNMIFIIKYFQQCVPHVDIYEYQSTANSDVFNNSHYLNNFL